MDLAEDDAFRDRFLRESELAASIDHPNIVPIYEAGATEGLLFIAMRYVEGRDLKGGCGTVRSIPRTRSGILAQVAIALDAAHARGLVHRDVKPSNVLLDTGARPDGSDHVYLADFGLTRRVADEAGLGEDGHLLGTIDYVAPEQIVGARVDGRADVYSLGCLLYECLVGEPPFPRDSELAVVFAHLETEPPSPSARAPEAPGRARRRHREGSREGAGAALRHLHGHRARRAGRLRRRRESPAGRRGLARRRRSQRPQRGRGRTRRERERTALVREQARALADRRAGPRRRRGDLPVQGPRELRARGRRRLLRPRAARRRARRAPRRRPLPRHRRAVGQRQVVGPPGRPASRARGRVLPDSEGWRGWLLRPGERPLEALARVLASEPRIRLQQTLDSLPDGTRLLLAVDQLEELFTACRDEGERVAFADLSSALPLIRGRALVVVALRADFYGRFAAYPGPRGAARREPRTGRADAGLGAAARRRAARRRVGLRVEPELTDALVDDVEGEPGALPLLSTALLELWQKRRDHTLSLAAYRESGGVHGAVARLAEGTYARSRRAASSSCAACCCAWSATARATPPSAGAPRCRARPRAQ